MRVGYQLHALAALPARSESLYRLSYPGSQKTFIHFLYGKNKKNRELGAEFSYIMESCQQVSDMTHISLIPR
jgi:hypothetical protein